MLRLTARHRLRHRWEFKKFFGKSEVFKLGECLVFRIPNELGHFRLGITMKARGSSVERNRVRRQVREGFRKHGPRLGSYDYNVVIPASKQLAHPYAERLRLALASGLEQIASAR